MKARWGVLIFAMALWVAVVAWRVSSELKQPIRGGASRRVVGTAWDPRGRSVIDAYAQASEAAAYRAELRYGTGGTFFWPGLKAMQLSWMWLEITQAVHTESSYDGDFSWIFGKLNILASETPNDDYDPLLFLAPFFFVIGKDGAGSTAIMNQMVHKIPNSWKSWFWGGFHANENLYLTNMAAALYAKSASLNGAPQYLPALSLRLASRDGRENEVVGELLKKDLPPGILERMKKLKPNLIRDSQ